MTPLLRQFVTEARELLDAAVQGLLALERTPGDADLINRVFRSVHTLKGNAGFFEFRAIGLAVHAGEDLLDAVRDGRLALGGEMVDALFAMCDTVLGWIAEIESRGTLDPRHDADARELARTLAAHGVDGGATLAAALAEPPAAAAAAAVAPAADTGWLAALDEATLQRAWMASGGRPLVLASYRPDPGCFFSGDDPCLTLLSVPEVLLESITLDREAPAPDALDPYDCNLRLHLASTAPLEQVRDKLRFVAEQAHCAAVPAAVLMRPAGGPTDPDLRHALALRLREAADEGTWEQVAAVADAALAELDPACFAASALRWLRVATATPRAGAAVVRPLIGALRDGALPERGLLPLADEGEAEADAATRAFFAIVQAQHDGLAQFGELPPDDPRLLPWRHALGLALAGHGDAQRSAGWAAACQAADGARSTRPLLTLLRGWLDDPRRGAAAEATAAALADAAPALPIGAAAGGAGAAAPPAVTTVRVEQEKLDKLMDLIGELVVAKNGLPYLAERAAGVHGNAELAREIKERHAVLHRIAQELQGSIMQVRMMPVSQVLQRFPRVVRDLARKLGKEVQLEISGEQTEADKTVIEAMADPLVHLLRNAVDHGIELPEQRRDAGKPAVGTVRIAAWQESDQVCIEIADDGGGIDPERVRRKALDKGLIDEARAAQLDDADAVQLVFAAGFSTAEQISDVSGRGVGMDVVRSSVERVGGRVSLSSRHGQGSSVRLSLPLSMAVSQVMAFRVGGQRFGIAMDRVVETLRLPPRQLFTIKHQEAFLLRDRLVPVQRMRGLLGLPPAAAGEEMAVLVVRVHGEPLGLVIDDFDEGMETIVKPLEGVLGGLPGLVGTALLGDGSVLLVVEPGALL